MKPNMVRKQLNDAMALAKLMRRAGTSRDNAAPRIRDHHGLTDAELRHVLIQVWGPEPKKVKPNPTTLYHGTSSSMAGRKTLSPRRGHALERAYGSDGRAYVFATEDFDSALMHARNRVEHDLGREPSDRELRLLSAVAVIRPRRSDWAHRPESDEDNSGSHPPEVEPGDWYSPYEVEVDSWIKGDDLRPNTLLSKPPVGYHRLQNTARFRRLLGRQPTDADYEGVHTTSNEAIAGAYAMGTWGHQDHEGYPVILTLDVSGLEPQPDVDALLQGAEAVDALITEYRRLVAEGADFYSLLNDDDFMELSAQAGDHPADFIFEDIGMRPLNSIETYAGLNGLDAEDVFAEFLETGELPSAVLTDMVQQQRYLNDFDLGRVVRIEAIKPWWPKVLVSWDDEEEVQPLVDAGWHVFTQDEWPFNDAGEKKAVWEAPDAKKRTNVEYHGTTSLVVAEAFPGLIPERTPFPVSAPDDLEENGPAKPMMAMDERVARKVAREMGDRLGGEEDWLRPDIITALKEFSLGYPLSEASELAEHLVEQSYCWESFADPDYGHE